MTARLFLIAATIAAAVLGGWAMPASAAERIVVGSKRFTEGYILGEVVAQTARRAGADATHKPGLGSTAVVLEALKLGSIDVYPEYLGTIEQEILRLAPGSDSRLIAQRLAALGLAIGVPLGFSNSYALATTSALAREHALRTIADLRAHPKLPIALSQEFLGRADGWPGLARRYDLPQRPTGIDHGLSYGALATGRIAVTDIYTTDARIADLGLVVLRDELGYFPRYDAMLLYRADLPQRAPTAWRALQTLQGRIDVDAMIRMNAQAELRGRAFDAIAKDFLDGRREGAGASGSQASVASVASIAPASTAARGAASGALADSEGGVASAASKGEPASRPASLASSVIDRLFAADLGRLTREHVWLVAVSVAIGVLFGLPLGAWAAARARWRQPIFALVGLLQTIPALALLAALIPLLGRIGTIPSVVALTLYALLPIVRNTATGLEQVPQGLQQAALALGMTRAQAWRAVDLPLAMPVILAGIKTAAVVTVGTATIAAFIGAGGYGERIAQGLALNDGAMLLAGAIPSALLALLTQAAFELVEKVMQRRRAMTA